MSPAVYQDNASIRDEDRLFRRVHITQLVRDDDTGLTRVSSGVFKDRELSINVESVLQDAGLSAEACLQNHSAHKLVSIAAGGARTLGQAICHDPLPADLSHGLVYGAKNSRSIHDGLRSAASWVIPPDPPRYEDVRAEMLNLGARE
jgi:hypothetical protein